jgi:hypothetical protein
VVMCGVANMTPRRCACSFSESLKRWVEERSRWRTIVMRCPAVGDDKNKCMRTRVVSTGVIVVFVVFVLLENLIGDNGTPYYLIFLTNWTGLLTGVYAVSFCACTVRAVREDVVDYEDIETPQTATTHSTQSIPLPAKILWLTKAAAPVSQFLITIMYWGLLYDGSAVRVATFVAHGGLSFMMAAELVATARMPINNLVDALITYVFLYTYLAFNILYTLGIPNASNPDGDPYVYGILDWRSHPTRSFILVVATTIVIVPFSYACAKALMFLRNKYFPEKNGGAIATAGLNTHTGKETHAREVLDVKQAANEA